MSEIKIPPLRKELVVPEHCHTGYRIREIERLRDYRKDAVIEAAYKAIAERNNLAGSVRDFDARLNDLEAFLRELYEVPGDE